MRHRAELRDTLDRMDRRKSMERFWLNVVWSVCHRRFEWIAPFFVVESTKYENRFITRWK